MIGLLEERFPKCFAVLERRRRPLKIGINHDIVAAVGFAPGELGRALRRYTQSDRYLAKLKAGAARIDLAGQTAGVVTADEAEQAAQALAERKARRAARKQHAAPSPPPPPPSSPPETNARLSIEGLRAAAASGAANSRNTRRSKCSFVCKPKEKTMKTVDETKVSGNMAMVTTEAAAMARMAELQNTLRATTDWPEDQIRQEVESRLAAGVKIFERRKAIMDAFNKALAGRDKDKLKLADLPRLARAYMPDMTDEEFAPSKRFAAARGLSFKAGGRPRELISFVCKPRGDRDDLDRNRVDE